MQKLHQDSLKVLAENTTPLPLNIEKLQFAFALSITLGGKPVTLKFNLSWARPKEPLCPLTDEKYLCALVRGGLCTTGEARADLARVGLSTSATTSLASSERSVLLSGLVHYLRVESLFSVQWIPPHMRSAPHSLFPRHELLVMNENASSHTQWVFVLDCKAGENVFPLGDLYKASVVLSDLTKTWWFRRNCTKCFNARNTFNSFRKFMCVL